MSRLGFKSWLGFFPRLSLNHSKQNCWVTSSVGPWTHFTFISIISLIIFNSYRLTRRTCRTWFQDSPTDGICLWELHISGEAAVASISGLRLGQGSVALTDRWRLGESWNRQQHGLLVEDATDSGT